MLYHLFSQSELTPFRDGLSRQGWINMVSPKNSRKTLFREQNIPTNDVCDITTAMLAKTNKM